MDNPAVMSVVNFLVVNVVSVGIYLLVAGAILTISVAVGWRRRRGDLGLAQDRAEALLRAILTEEEYAQLGKRGYLEVPSPSQPTRTYRVPRGPGWVSVQERGVVVESLCVGPVGWLPPGDVLLTHKLMIEGDEQEYLRRANRYGPRALDRIRAIGG